MDVYYEEEKLKAWRDNCLKSILNCQKKLGTMQDNFNQFLSAVMDKDFLNNASFASEVEL